VIAGPVAPGGADSNSPRVRADSGGMLFLLPLRAILLSGMSLALENLALRQQVALLKRSMPRRASGCATAFSMGEDPIENRRGEDDLRRDVGPLARSQVEPGIRLYWTPLRVWCCRHETGLGIGESQGVGSLECAAEFLTRSSGDGKCVRGLGGGPLASRIPSCMNRSMVVDGA
jgi:hypothetical protein